MLLNYTAHTYRKDIAHTNHFVVPHYGARFQASGGTFFRAWGRHWVRAWLVDKGCHLGYTQNGGVSLS